MIKIKYPLPGFVSLTATRTLKLSSFKSHKDKSLNIVFFCRLNEIKALTIVNVRIFGIKTRIEKISVAPNSFSSRLDQTWACFKLNNLGLRTMNIYSQKCSKIL